MLSRVGFQGFAYRFYSRLMRPRIRLPRTEFYLTSACAWVSLSAVQPDAVALRWDRSEQAEMQAGHEIDAGGIRGGDDAPVLCDHLILAALLAVCEEGTPQKFCFAFLGTWRQLPDRPLTQFGS